MPMFNEAPTVRDLPFVQRMHHPLPMYGTEGHVHFVVLNTVGAFRHWKQSVILEVTAASARDPRMVTPWISKAFIARPSELTDSEGVDMLDAKSAAAVTRAIQSFAQLANHVAGQVENLELRQGESMRGRQRLAVIAQYCSVGAKWKTLELLGSLQLRDNNVELFVEAWCPMVAELQYQDLDENLLAEMLYSKMQNTTTFSFEAAQYARGSLDSPFWKYSYLVDAMDRAAHQKRIESHQRMRMQKGGLEGKRQTDKPPYTYANLTQEERKGEQRGRSEGPEPKGKGQRVCWYFNKEGGKCMRANCPFLHESHVPRAGSPTTPKGKGKKGPNRVRLNDVKSDAATADYTIMTAVIHPVVPTTTEDDGRSTVAASAKVASRDPRARAWIVDTGAGHDVIGRSGLLDTWEHKARNTDLEYRVTTANGIIPVAEMLPLYIPILQEIVEPMLLEDTPPLLAVGKRCLKYGYSFHWPAGQKPILHSGIGQTHST